MILPVLLICPLHIQKYLYTHVGNKLQSLTAQVRNLIAQIYGQLFNWQLTFIAPNKNYLSNVNSANNNTLLINNDLYCHQVLACNEQKNPQWFKNMSPGKKQETLRHLKSEYREILIDYFVSDQNLKNKIDKFINSLFYANIPVLQIIEIHMELIDEFSKQLKLEGRSDETLLDYRLTLIDILANLCEAYRCAISKNN